MKKSLLLILLVITLMSCEKQKQEEYSNSLIGEWAWISSCGGIAGQCFTPESSKHNIKITFSIDSLFNIYQDGILTRSDKYYIIISPPADMPGTANMIKYGQNISTYFDIHHDTLTLNDSYIDGFISLYKRIK